MVEQGTSRRGRPVSEASRVGALASAAELLDERGWAGFSVDEVARRSRVGKATIYKHWPTGFALAVQAWGDRVTAAVPTLNSGDARRDLHDQVVRLARFYRSRSGAVAVELLGAGVSAENGAELIAAHFFGVRRAATLALIREGIERGQLSGELEPQLVVDVLFGPIVFRLVNGMPPLTDAEAGTLAELTLGALAEDGRSLDLHE